MITGHWSKVTVVTHRLAGALLWVTPGPATPSHSRSTDHDSENGSMVTPG